MISPRVTRSVPPDLRLHEGSIALLRGTLDEMGYDHILRAVRGSYPLTPFPPYEQFRGRARSLPERERLWFELLLLGRPLPGAAVVSALGAEMTRVLEELGVLRRRGIRLATPSLGLTSLDGRFAFSSLPADYPTCGDRSRRAYAGEETYLLTHFLPPSKSGVALDMCSGSGVLAFAMAGLADRVVGVDIDPVSINVSTFNALLNGLDDRVTFHAGDLWEPLGAQRFDLVAFNAPFVPLPWRESRVVFRDGGPDGLAVLGPLLDGLAEHLGDGGCAVTQAEGFGDRSRPFIASRLAAMARRDGLTIDLLLLYRHRLTRFLREAAQGRGLSESAYRRLANEVGAERYYRFLVRLRRGRPGLRTIDAGRYL